MQNSPPSRYIWGMEWKIYHNPRCRKSREALAYLEEKGIEPEVILYLKEPPTADELADILKHLDMTPGQLIRKEEAIYKAEIKEKDLSDRALLQWMIKEPRLIQRPIVFHGTRAVVARPYQEVDQLLS